eukprot:190650_1
MAVQGPHGAKLFRNKTVNTVLVVPTKARKYRKALYLFNFILTGFGLTCISLAVVMLRLSSQTFFPDWAFSIVLSIGVVIIIIGFLGGRGSVISFHCLQKGDYNWWLIALTLLMSTLIAAEVVGGAWGIVSWGVIKSDTASEKSDAFTQVFEAELKGQLTAQPDLWWDFQKQLLCCGYENNTVPAALATGKYCTTEATTSAPGCKEQIWTEIENNMLPFVIFGVSFFLIQTAVCVSGMCLACIIKAQEPIYRD